MISERIKMIREKSEISQEKISKALKVNRSTYAGWENNIDPIPLAKLNDFCNFFNVTFDYICGLSNDSKSANFTNSAITPERISLKLKSIRKQNKESQKTISNIIGLDQSNYSKIERGKYLIRLYPLIEFAKHYNCSIDYLCDKYK